MAESKEELKSLLMKGKEEGVEKLVYPPGPPFLPLQGTTSATQIPLLTQGPHIGFLSPTSYSLFSFLFFVIAVQSLSRVRLPKTPWIAACQASLNFSISGSLLKFMSIELSDAI